MRDDLHHSISPNSPWRAAVRAACSPGIDGNLALAIERAVWSTAGASLSTAWGDSFKSLLSSKQNDFFDQERLERGLQHLEHSAPDHAAHRLCEIAYAAIQREEPSLNLYKYVVHATFEAHAEDCVENCAARVESDHHQYQAREVRRSMLAAIGSCNFSSPPLPKARPSRKTIEDGLGMKLPVRL